MLIRTCLFLAVALIYLSTGSAYSMDRSQKWGLGLDLGASVPTAPGVFRGMADVGVAAGAHVRYHLDPLWGVELSYDHLHFTNTSLSGDAINANIFARLHKTANLTPWLSLGLGPDHLSNYTAGSYWRFGIKAEGGVEYDWCPNLSVGAKLAYFFVTKNNDALHELAPSLVATWYFGPSHAQEPVAETLEPVRATIAAAPQGNFEKAVAAGQTGIKLNVEFESGKSALTASSLPEVEQVARFLKDNSEAKITLEGHCDSSGNTKKNLALSQSRADAVRKALVDEYGADGSRIKSIGYGSARPIASNKTKAGRARNRRVMAVINSK